MGSALYQVSSTFSIPPENEEQAFLGAKQKLLALLIGDPWTEYEASVRASCSLDELTLCFRWRLIRQDDDVIEDIEFIGEKIGADALLMAVLAPYVEDGSYVECEWASEFIRWRWAGGEFYEDSGEIRYPETTVPVTPEEVIRHRY